MTSLPAKASFINMSVSDAAAALNNQGVQLLQANKFEQAATYFSQSLSGVKKYLTTLPSGANTADEIYDADCSETSPLCCFHNSSQHHLDTNNDNNNNNNENMVPFVYCSPLSVLPSVDFPTSASAYFKHHVKLSFIILYNLALTHHMKALQGVGSLKRLQKALALYELAYTIQMNEGVQLTVMQNMAIVNNLGHIHTLMQNQAKADQCFQHLLSTIMYVNDCQFNCNVNNDYNNDDNATPIQGFLSNVLHLILQGTTAAAA